MAHVRQSIRENITTTLTGLTTTGSNVYQTRIYPVAEDKLPGIAIYTRTEDTEYQTITLPRTQERTLVIAVEAYVKALNNYDDTLDTIAAEVEGALYTDLTRGGYAKDTRVVSFDSQFSGDGDQPIAYATIEVQVDYFTEEDDAETAV
jgi:hypothetical protein